MKAQPMLHLVEDAARFLLPPWIRVPRSASAPEAAFASGAALAVLHPLVATSKAAPLHNVPLDALSDRLALYAAEACAILIGRPERAEDLRDEVHLLRAGERPGPTGVVFQRFRDAGAARAHAEPAGVSRPIAEAFGPWFAEAEGGPVVRAARLLERALDKEGADEATALILADTALARALGWGRMLPLVALGLPRARLRARGPELDLACHGAVLAGIRRALPVAADLSRAAARLSSVAPKLRAKPAGRAVALFLSQDALSPGIALTAPAVGLSDRSARRLCDRLVSLGAVRELTGRATFRLYGL
ncbi:MAG: DUF1403 family protein [Pseudomonadota bacterium]